MSQDIKEEKQIPNSLETKLEATTKADEKIRLCLDFMKEALSQKKDADFKIFWETKAKCIEIFKKDLSPYIRERLWNEYLEINHLEKSLKKHLEQEANFAKEQISLAIDSLENDVKNIYQLIAKEQDIEVPNIPVQKELIAEYQKELNILRVLTVKMQSLKNELLSMQIRYREKNVFLKKLSTLADKIYPRRKALVVELSDTFLQDVQEYSSKIFPKTLKTARYYDIKETIKNFQALAKLLALNTPTFSSTRQKLSHLWDDVKKLDDQRRKVTLEKKDVFAKNSLEIQMKIDALIQKQAKEDLAEETFLKEVALILESMKAVELASKDVKSLKGTLEKMQAEILEKKAEISAAIALKEKESISNLKTDALALLREKHTLESHSQKKEQLKKAVSEVNLSLTDKELLEDLLASANIFELKEAQEITAKLEEFLGYEKEVRMRIKRYKKILGVSVQDFEKGFIYQELLEREKEQLEEIEKIIEMLEEKALD